MNVDECRCCLYKKKSFFSYQMIYHHMSSIENVSNTERNINKKKSKNKNYWRFFGNNDEKFHNFMCLMMIKLIFFFACWSQRISQNIISAQNFKWLEMTNNIKNLLSMLFINSWRRFINQISVFIFLATSRLISLFHFSYSSSQDFDLWFYFIVDVFDISK